MLKMDRWWYRWIQFAKYGSFIDSEFESEYI